MSPREGKRKARARRARRKFAQDLCHIPKVPNSVLSCEKTCNFTQDEIGDLLFLAGRKLQSQEANLLFTSERHPFQSVVLGHPFFFFWFHFNFRLATSYKLGARWGGDWNLILLRPQLHHYDQSEMTGKQK